MLTLSERKRRLTTIKMVCEGLPGNEYLKFFWTRSFHITAALMKKF